MNTRRILEVEETIQKLDERIELCELRITYPPSGCSYPSSWREAQNDLLRELKAARSFLVVELVQLTEQFEFALGLDN